ncbi:MAG: hypothetical protein R2824_33475 [Saprospiraceae bacterium]|nr:hypothetical protein [Lewinella sp.]
MTFRIILTFVSIAALINGCSGLISQQFGTGKLQVFAMKDLSQTDLSKKDFIQLSDAQITGDFIFAPGKVDNNRAVVLYPLVDEAQLDSLREGRKIHINLMAWENRRPGSEADTVSLGMQPKEYLGLIRPPGKRFEQPEALDSNKYQMSENLAYLAIGRKPLSWEWNAVIMMASLLILLLMVRRSASTRSAKKT